MGAQPGEGSLRRAGWGSEQPRAHCVCGGLAPDVLGWSLLPVFLALTTGTKCPTSGPRQHSCCDLGGAVPACTPLVFCSSSGEISVQARWVEGLERSPTFLRT